MFPLFGAWQTAYNTDVTDVTITGSGTGSGTGIADAATGTVTMGASDAYLSSSDISQYPGLINIPVAVASLMVNYNVPGIKKPLNFNGKLLAEIYTGKVKTWNDPAIKALNPGQNLPAMKITALHRAESSGSTFLFTSYLNAQDPADWPVTAVGTTVSWPSGAAAQAETGSGGMVTGCQAIKGCIAYIGISYLSKTQDAGLGEAALANKAGKFVQPTTGAVSAALASFGTIPASGSQSLINTVGPQGLPDHQLRVHDREEAAGQRRGGRRAQGLPEVDHHRRGRPEVPGRGGLRAAAVQRCDRLSEPDLEHQFLI